MKMLMAICDQGVVEKLGTNTNELIIRNDHNNRRVPDVFMQRHQRPPHPKVTRYRSTVQFQDTWGTLCLPSMEIKYFLGHRHTRRWLWLKTLCHHVKLDDMSCTTAGYRGLRRKQTMTGREWSTPPPTQKVPTPWFPPGLWLTFRRLTHTLFADP